MTGEKRDDDRVVLRDMSGEPQFLNTYYDEGSGDRKPRRIQIARMTVTCAHCAKTFEMKGTEKGIDLVRDNEIWTGRCPECFAMNLLQFHVNLESVRLPSEATLARLRAERDSRVMSTAINWTIGDEGENGEERRDKEDAGRDQAVL